MRLSSRWITVQNSCKISSRTVAFPKQRLLVILVSGVEVNVAVAFIVICMSKVIDSKVIIYSIFTRPATKALLYR